MVSLLLWRAGWAVGVRLCLRGGSSGMETVGEDRREFVERVERMEERLRA